MRSCWGAVFEKVTSSTVWADMLKGARLFTLLSRVIASAQMFRFQCALQKRFCSFFLGSGALSGFSRLIKMEFSNKVLTWPSALNYLLYHWLLIGKSLDENFSLNPMCKHCKVWRVDPCTFQKQPMIGQKSLSGVKWSCIWKYTTKPLSNIVKFLMLCSKAFSSFILTLIFFPKLIYLNWYVLLIWTLLQSQDMLIGSNSLSRIWQKHFGFTAKKRILSGVN